MYLVRLRRLTMMVYDCCNCGKPVLCIGSKLCPCCNRPIWLHLICCSIDGRVLFQVYPLQQETERRYCSYWRWLQSPSWIYTLFVPFWIPVVCNFLNVISKIYQLYCIRLHRIAYGLGYFRSIRRHKSTWTFGFIPKSTELPGWTWLSCVLNTRMNAQTNHSRLTLFDEMPKSRNEMKKRNNEIKWRNRWSIIRVRYGGSYAIFYISQPLGHRKVPGYHIYAPCRELFSRSEPHQLYTRSENTYSR